MKEVTVIGGGAAGLNFITQCRVSGFDGKIKLIDKNSYWYDRAAFYNSFNFKNRIDYASFCKEHKVQFIQDAVDRINPKRKKIYFKNRESIDFEQLVAVPGVKPRKLPVKGEHREGFYYLSDIDIMQLRDRLRFTDDICIYVSTLPGIRLVNYLRSMNKDLSLVAKDLDFLTDKKDIFLDWCRREKIGIYLNASVEEAIGEASVKAVKLNPLKVVSAQILLLDSGFVSGADFFEEPLEEARKIEDIFIAGDAAADLANEHFFANNGADAAAYVKALAVSLINGSAIAFSPAPVTDINGILNTLSARWAQNAGV